MKLVYDRDAFVDQELAKTAVQLVLMISEHPAIRAELSDTEKCPVVEYLRDLDTYADLDPLLGKVVEKALDTIFWKP